MGQSGRFWIDMGPSILSQNGRYWAKAHCWLLIGQILGIFEKIGKHQFKCPLRRPLLTILENWSWSYLVSFWLILFWEIAQFFHGVWPTRGRCEMIVCIPTWILQWLFCCRYQSLSDCHWLKLETLLDLSTLSTIESMNQKDLKNTMMPYCKCMLNMSVRLKPATHHTQGLHAVMAISGIHKQMRDERQN